MRYQKLERIILSEAKELFKNQKLKMKDILEWTTSNPKIQEGEVTAYLPGIGVNVCIKTSNDKRTPQTHEQETNTTETPSKHR